MFGLTVNPLSTDIDSLASDSVGQEVHQRAAVPALMLCRQSTEQKNFYQSICFTLEE